MFLLSFLTAVSPKRVFRQARCGKQGFTLIEIMIVILIIGILLTIAVPNFVRARQNARVKSCVSNLKQIQAAKQQWAMDNNKNGMDSPPANDLFGTGKYINGPATGPVCPEGTTLYNPGPVDNNAICPNAAVNPLHTLANLSQ